MSATLDPAAARDADERSRALLTVIDAVARELHRGHAGLPAARLDSSLAEELAIDSLARVELGQRLEQVFGCTLADQHLFDAETPRDLLAALDASAGRASLALPPRATPAPGPRAALPLPDSVDNLVDMLAWHAERHGERLHAEFHSDAGDGPTLTYRALWDGAARVAAGLQRDGLAPGARVALMLPTGEDYFFGFFGALLAGGVPVPIYPPQRRAQLEEHLRRQGRILANCQATTLITTAEASAVARLLTAQVDTLGSVTTVEALSGHGAQFERAAPAADSLAFLQYTSGSTGDPKGVMLSHANLLANIRADGQGIAVTSDDVFVSWLPLYHDMGLIGAWLGSLYHGVKLVIMSPLAFLARPERWLWAMHRHRGTLSAAPNFAYELCVTRLDDARLEGLDLSSWRLALNGAEAISAETLEAFCARFARYGLRPTAMLPVYGLAECAVGLCFSPIGRAPRIDEIERDTLAREGRAVPAAPDLPAARRRRVVTCGLPLPRHELRVVDAARRELPDRHEGQVHFRGPSATRGYFGNPAESARLIGADGWLDSGDRGYLAGGELFITGRVKDIIIRAGRNIYPAELEDAIGDLDGVRKGRVAVFGSPDPDNGTERVVVLAETRKRGEAQRAALEGAIKSLAATLIATPPDVVVLAPPNTVLRTSSGKIRRGACRTLWEDGRIGERAPPLWLQFTRLALAGVLPRVRRALRELREGLFAAWAWTLFAVLGGLALGVASLPLERATVWRATRALARGLARLSATPLNVAGLEHVPPAGQGVVLVVNHQSYLDGLLMAAALPRAPRFLVKAELARSALLARPLARLGALFVDRFDAAGGIASLRAAAAELAAGELLVVFPEGTFKRMPGVLPFHLGAFTLAAQSGVPLLPAALSGTRAILRDGSSFPRHGAVGLVIGPPARAETTASVWQAALALRDTARAHVLTHCDEPDLAHESNAVARA